MSQRSPNNPTPTTSSGARKPRISLAIATAFGLGYIPKAPGTWGSLGGVAISLGIHWIGWRKTLPYLDLVPRSNFWTIGLFPEGVDYLAVLLISILGVYAADQAAKYAGKKDPQFVVI